MHRTCPIKATPLRDKINRREMIMTDRAVSRESEEAEVVVGAAMDSFNFAHSRVVGVVVGLLVVGGTVVTMVDDPVAGLTVVSSSLSMIQSTQEGTSPV
uniref:Uncharacterized protein n=1 Tax=Pristionchus pacificus TaxID=54126 RepID=A0A2A6CYF9_PRIPA|eukprot:PDM83140.1 hypothetical protein PRIPAC_37533 [Pristionchus pacificus]